MKARVISYHEVEEMFQQVLKNLGNDPLEEEAVIKTGSELIFLLRLCISQMKATNAVSYPEKSVHLAILENASSAITYKMNSCTVEQIANQVNTAYRYFGVQ